MLREKLKELLGVDRWVEGSHPIVAPENESEVCKLLRGYIAGSITVVGSGSNFDEDFEVEKNSLILLTTKLTEAFKIDTSNLTATISAGWVIKNVHEGLLKKDLMIPPLQQVENGTVGGRLGSISSRVRAGNSNGWVQWLLGLDVVLPSGEKLTLGGECIKNVAGYDLKSLFLGSRGSIGVIVSATFKCKFSSIAVRKEDLVYMTPARPFSSKWKKKIDPMGRMKAGA